MRRVTYSAVIACLLFVALTTPAAARSPADVAAPAARSPTQYRDQLRSELDSLLRVGVNRPYGLAWSDAPEPTLRNAPRNSPAPIVSYESSHTPAAGLLLHLASRLLDTTPDFAPDAQRFSEAALAVARGMQSSVDSNGRLPGSATFTPSGVSNREPYGSFPRRNPTTAALGFLLILDRDLDGKDIRVASTTVRMSNWLLKQQLSPGVFPVSIEFPGEKYPRRVVRLDLPDTRDGVLTLLLIQLSAKDRDTSLPSTPARFAAERAVQQLIRLRISELGKSSRHLWPSVFDMNSTVITVLPDLPPAGNLLASRYALQTLLAYHLHTGDIEIFDIAKLSAEALSERKTPANTFPLIDDPKNKYPPPTPKPATELEAFTNPPGPPIWPQRDYGISDTLRTTADLRVLGHPTFSRLTARTIPPDLALAYILTGVLDQLPTADLPLSAAQIPPFQFAYPEFFAPLEGPEPVNLTPRIKRLAALYLLASWEQRFSTPTSPPSP